MNKENEDIIKIYNNQIDIAIDEACELMGIESLNKEPQARWKGVCQYVGQRVFHNRKKLKSVKMYPQESLGIMSTYAMYNQELIADIFEYYVFLSRKYDKIISMIAFSEFINIPYGTIQGWKNTDKLNKAGCCLHKKIQELREDSLKDAALDNGNVMGIFQVGRLEHSWDMPGVSNKEARPALSAADLPRLVGGNVHPSPTDTEEG